MTKEQIIGYAIAGVISIFLAPLSNSIARKYIDPMLPDKKKAISYIRNFFVFIIKYALPIFIITYLMIDKNVVVDKSFILVIVIFVSILFFYLITWIIGFQESATMAHRQMLNRHWQEISTQITLSGMNEEFFKVLHQLHEKHFEISDKLEERIKRLEAWRINRPN